MAQPYMSVCIPNNEQPVFHNSWSYGNIARNIMYGYIYVHLGTDPTLWLTRLHITPAQIRTLCVCITNLTFLFTESNFELFLKRIIMLFIKSIGNES